MHPKLKIHAKKIPFGMEGLDHSEVATMDYGEPLQSADNFGANNISDNPPPPQQGIPGPDFGGEGEMVDMPFEDRGFGAGPAG